MGAAEPARAGPAGGATTAGCSCSATGPCAFTLPSPYSGALPFGGATPRPEPLAQITALSSGGGSFELGDTRPWGIAAYNLAPVTTGSPGQVFCGPAQPPALAFTDIDSRYVSAGVHAAPAGFRYTHRSGPCAGQAASQVSIRITDAIRDQVRAGEQEHVDDAVQGFRLSLGPYLALVRSMTDRTFGPCPTELACRTKMLDENSRLYQQELRRSTRLWAQSLDRDVQGWHGVELDPATARPGQTCDEVTVGVKTGTRWNVGAVPASQQIRP